MTDQEQIDALKAQVNCLREALTNAVKAPNYTFHYAKEALGATPEQCLAEVKAKAIEDAVELLSCQTITGNICYSRDLLDHAKELREQAK